jgi:Ribbon-helix-helix protein, copG family
MIRTNIFLTEPQLAALRRLSDSTGLSVAELIRRAIDTYMADVTPIPGKQ